MRRLGRFAARRPAWVLSAWAVVFVVALLTASNAREQIHQTDLQIPGSDSARAAQLTKQQFGNSTLALAALLIGRQRTVDTVGPAIVTRLDRIDGVEVLSPWDGSGRRVLQEKHGQALLLLQVHKPLKRIFDETTPAVERALAPYRGRDGLRIELTGQAPLMRAINQTALDALDKGELIALPILVIMLLAIFRSPLAALVPAISGLLVTRVGTALMGLIGRGVEIDALALNMVAMIGLALGVDYSLLVVSRFREELAAGRSVPDAVEETAARAGRTVLFAGSALAVGMLTALVMAPGSLLVSSALGLFVATIVAVVVALFAMPAGLMLLGTNVNRWQFGGARTASPWVAVAERALRRPGAAAFFVLLPLLLLSAPAIGLNTGPPSLQNLPPDNPARLSFERFQQARGAGWAAPFEVDFRTRGPITTTERLQAIDDFQRRVSALPGVTSVLGPAVLLDRTRQLRELTTQALGLGTPLARLESGLRAATNGTAALRDGLAAGADGASQLVTGIDQLAGGSGQLADGAHRAAPATHRLAAGIAQAGRGAKRLNGALARAQPNVKKLEQNVNVLRDSLTQADRTAGSQLVNPLDDASSSVQTAQRELGSAIADDPAAASDPHVQQALSAANDALFKLGDVQQQLSLALTSQTANAIAARQLARAVTRLDGALGRFGDATGKLATGLGRAAGGAQRLATGTGQLSAGLDQLHAGVQLLLDGPHGSDGARALADGLQAAAGGSNRLGGGMRRILDGVVRVRAQSDAQRAQLRSGGTDLSKAIGSGYFVLAAIQGADARTQANTDFVANVADGGGTARIIVVPRAGPFDPSSVAVARRLRAETARAAQQLGAQTAVVGGPAVLLNDFDRATSARFPWLVVALVAITFLVLLLLFRSPVLALCAVLLNLVTVGAAVGVLVICFQGSAPLLGGPGYLDAIALSGIFAIIFGLSIDYEVFLITRLLEGRARTGTTEGAIHYGLEKTGTIITGAAFIMAAVFLAFAVSPVTNTRQFGVGLTVAVLLDATIVRLILLPALIRLFGERTWHVPAWLDRILPRIASH
ncbi:MAG: MMPL family transporter [Actinobacteria bacterium]|nr:MMPL family transporter [Actinomycetota bacterium]